MSGYGCHKAVTTILVVLGVLMGGCSASRYLAVPEIEKGQAVRLYLASGAIVEGIIIERGGTELTVVLEEDHQPHVFKFSEIRRVERSPKNYDYQAYPISEAEIEKYRTNRNALVYPVGGAVLGFLSGVAIGLPVWLAADDPPPFFVGGVGAVIGSIYFATRGMRKDREDAIQRVRYIRDRENQLEAEKRAEEERLRELERQKQELLKRLEEKKKRQQESDGSW
ncbi:MAG: hypothetical protein D6681_08775 [Calditrichaeota bacterium]|nr:MAG: hypothetical protein D6681_08775 [Calditrichota bacterium]